MQDLLAVFAQRRGVEDGRGVGAECLTSRSEFGGYSTPTKMTAVASVMRGNLEGNRRNESRIKESRRTLTDKAKFRGRRQ
jgi:hypothetical protein